MTAGGKCAGKGSTTELPVDSQSALYPSLRKTDNNPASTSRLGIRVYTGRLMSETPETNDASLDRADGRTRMGRDLVALLPRLRRFAAGLTGSVQEGDDVLQTACLRALERYHQWEPG